MVILLKTSWNQNMMNHKQRGEQYKVNSAVHTRVQPLERVSTTWDSFVFRLQYRGNTVDTSVIPYHVTL